MPAPDLFDARGLPSPWQHRDPWPPGAGRHDPETCEVCAPGRTAAAARARTAAEAAEPR